MQRKFAVFAGRRRVTLINGNNMALLNFGNSKLLVTEFTMIYRARHGEMPEQTEFELRELEQRLVDQFDDPDTVYLTSRGRFWIEIEGKNETIYHATVSATSMKMFRALDETTIERVIQ